MARSLLRLCSFLLVLLTVPGLLEAQRHVLPSAGSAAGSGVSMWGAADCTTITSPVVGQSFCFDQTAGALKGWTGTTWLPLSIQLRATGGSVLGVGSNSFIDANGPHIEIVSAPSASAPGFLVMRNTASAATGVGSTIAFYGNNSTLPAVDENGQFFILGQWASATGLDAKATLALRLADATVTGTLAITSGAATVTGTSTAFLAELNATDVLAVTGAPVGGGCTGAVQTLTVSTVTNNTTMAFTGNSSETCTAATATIVGGVRSRIVLGGVGTVGTAARNIGMLINARAPGTTGSEAPLEPLHVVTNVGDTGIRLDRTATTAGTYSLAITSAGNFGIQETGVGSRLEIAKTTGAITVNDYVVSPLRIGVGAASATVDVRGNTAGGAQVNLREGAGATVRASWQFASPDTYLDYTGTLHHRDAAGGGTDRMQLIAGLLLGAPTGGDQGAGTINVDTNIFRDGGAYTNPDYVLEHWATGRIDIFRDRDGADVYDGLQPLSRVADFMRDNHTLPRVGQARERARSKGTALGLFDGSDAVLASLEEAYLYILQLETRIRTLEMLEQRVQALEERRN